MTVAKWLNLYPDFTIYVRQGGADLVTHSGTRIDVKTTTYATGRLLAKINTAYESIDVFVLVTTDYPTFTVRGWATKEQLINPENIINLGHGDGNLLNQPIYFGLSIIVCCKSTGTLDKSYNIFYPFHFLDPLDPLPVLAGTIISTPDRTLRTKPLLNCAGCFFDLDCLVTNIEW